MAGGSPPTETQDGPGCRQTSPLLTPPHAGTSGGERKRRKEAKCGPCCGIPCIANCGSDWRGVGYLFKHWSTRARDFAVGHSELAETVVSCDYCNLLLAHCDNRINVNHSRSPWPSTGDSGAGPHNSRPTTGGCRHQSYAGKSDFLVKLLCCWLLTHALQSGSNPWSAQAAAVPSPPYLSSLPTASRYQLVPPSQYNDTIFIFFNPASILNLRVNTRQSVFFNFTLYTRRVAANPTNGIKNDKVTTTRPVSSTASDFTSDRALRDAADTTAATKAVPLDNPSHPTPAASQSPFSLTSLTSTFPTARPNISSSRFLNNSLTPTNGPTTYWVIIYSDDDSIARPLPNGLAAPHADAKGTYILMAVAAGRQHNFSVEARHIGRVTMSVAVVGDKGIPQASYVQAVAASQYQVTTVRGERTADIVFNSAAAAIAIIISFGIGAITDTDSLKRQLKYPVALIIGFCSQFIIMPVLAFGMAMMLPLQKDISFGLLCVACVPGGGLSHVAVIIADGDTALSLTMNLISVVAMLGTAPLWIFVLGQYFQTNPDAVLNPRMLPIYNFEIWLASTFFAYAFGLVIKRIRPAIADAILMWLIKPFLLLASILYITLGVYINMYVFELVNTYALIGAMLLPVCGCVVGGAMAAICRQNLASVKTIALETSSLNCLVVMVALRFSLKQPDADLAAMIPIWVMFTIPGLFVSLAICNKAKLVLVHYWQNRHNKESDMQNSSKAYSVSSSVVSPPGTTTLSAPLVTADGLDDDATISTMSNQKVTVL